MRNILKNTEISCDNCHKTFKIKKLKTKWINDNVQRIYFTCPYCKQEYTSFYKDERIRKNIKKIDDLQRQYDEIVKENKEIMQELREKYES
ncbi:uncharacterized Zn finger protein (UPF0148 family) [Clostridium algifaecis]|uniref:Uncharacterized Zn finger protein (UPF0148 family) n=1 Tax=Clostridium algifaecis TaxID=1472040 RepID=A0ABS4KRA6_9CLOT|nr:hypothetical protein [Clostridium algifaecis]MBP2032572.1 uncharacterized Zn finger protein (UPF0148 family) [Clostridium algifaecis]